MTQARSGAVRSAVAQLICSSSPPDWAATQRSRLPRVSGPASGSCRRAGFDRSAGERPRHCRSAWASGLPLGWLAGGQVPGGWVPARAFRTEVAEPSRARRMITTVRRFRRERRSCDEPRPLPQRWSGQSLRSARRAEPSVTASPRRYLDARRVADVRSCRIAGVCATHSYAPVWLIIRCRVRVGRQSDPSP
jgi:hypothetical protein